MEQNKWFLRKKYTSNVRNQPIPPKRRNHLLPMGTCGPERKIRPPAQLSAHEIAAIPTRGGLWGERNPVLLTAGRERLRAMGSGAAVGGGESCER